MCLGHGRDGGSWRGGRVVIRVCSCIHTCSSPAVHQEQGLGHTAGFGSNFEPRPSLPACYASASASPYGPSPPTPAASSLRPQPCPAHHAASPLPPLPCPAGNLFNPTIGPEVKAFILDKLSKKLAYLNDTLLKGKKFVVGDKWTIADSYLYICLTW